MIENLNTAPVPVAKPTMPWFPFPQWTGRLDPANGELVPTNQKQEVRHDNHWAK